jgi:hypothetical protein
MAYLLQAQYPFSLSVLWKKGRYCNLHVAGSIMGHGQGKNTQNSSITGDLVHCTCKRTKPTHYCTVLVPKAIEQQN